MSGCQECAFCNPCENPSKQTNKQKNVAGNNTLHLSAQLIELLNAEPGAGQHACVGGKKYSDISVSKIRQVEPGEDRLSFLVVCVRVCVLFTNIQVSDQKFMLIDDSSSKIPRLPWDVLPPTLPPKEAALACVCTVRSWTLPWILLCLPKEMGQRSSLCSKLHQPDLLTYLFMQT